MNSNTLDIIQKEAQEYASHKRLSFYDDLAPELSYSRQIFFDHPLILRCCEDVLPFLNDEFGHGIKHSKNVAIESGAIVLAESFYRDQERSRHLVLLAHIAALLHDICRLEEEHAVEGARMSHYILKDYPLTDRDKGLLHTAIEFHEAFRPYTPPEDPEEFFLSAALYDADKFRWGPDNFITTLWEICDYQEWPLDKIMDKFPEGLRIIDSIQDTFRSQTGRVYGPEFIETGLEIGDFVFRRLREHVRRSAAQ
jgi:hypothetical protein